MCTNNILVTNIQRFSLHDGPGIRTTVFLKGCSLCCPWCSNPENINPFPERYIRDGKEGIYGKEFTVDEVFNEVKKDKVFYGVDGGVTFSGGEALLQAEAILPLLKKIKGAGITTALETCLFAPLQNLELLIPLIDYFYVDMKILDEVECHRIIQGNLPIYKRNLEFLCLHKKIIIRLPVIGGYTDSGANKTLIIKEIKKFSNSIIRIELIKEHNLGKSKYVSLGMMEPKYMGVNDEALEHYKKIIESEIDIPVSICKI